LRLCAIICQVETTFGGDDARGWDISDLNGLGEAAVRYKRQQSGHGDMLRLIGPTRHPRRWPFAP
jgi:hypothetical protein